MNKAHQLLDKNFILQLLRDKVLPLYPDFSDIKNINIIPHKDFIWGGGTYHLVIEYRTRFVNHAGKQRTLPIYCSAHSDEPRKNVFDGLKFLWEHGFGKGYLTIPHPLFYSDYFQATFYRGVEGQNLYKYIREKNTAVIEEMIPKAAKWFAKLHSLSIDKARNFNQENSRIETVFPGIPHILWRIEQKYPQYRDSYEKIYNIVNEREKEYISDADKLYLVHGDAHPENIIKMGQRKIAVIDFTDLCLSDYTRDIGSFVQQLEFMVNRKIGNRAYTEKLKKMFLDNYFQTSKRRLDGRTQARIDNYYYWTAMRTATHFFLKDNSEPKRAYPLVDKVCKELNIK